MLRALWVRFSTAVLEEAGDIVVKYNVRGCRAKEPLGLVLFNCNHVVTYSKGFFFYYVC